MPHPTARWRYGDRDDQARVAHNDETRRWRREIADAVFPDETRARLLELVAAGASPAEAARAVEIPVQAVYSRARWDDNWREALDEATLAGRDPDARHSTAAGYRWDRCRCPECRGTHVTESR